MKQYGLLLMWLIVSVSGSAFAQDDEAAKQAFDEGAVLFDNLEYEKAATKFREAYDLNPSWKLLYNIGQAESAAKRYGLALEAFQKYITTGGDEVPNERQDELIMEVSRLKMKVGYFEIIGPDSVDIWVDGILRGTTPLPGVVIVASGVSHDVEAKRDDESLLFQSVSVVTDKTRNIVIPEKEQIKSGNKNAPPSAIATNEVGSSPNDAAVDTGQGLRTSGLVLGSLGVGFGVAGIITGIKTKSLDEELDDNCPGGVCPPGYDDKIKQEKNLGTTTDVLLISGGAFLATGVVLFIVGMMKKKSVSSMHVLPAVGREHAGLQLIRSF